MSFMRVSLFAPVGFACRNRGRDYLQASAPRRATPGGLVRTGAALRAAIRPSTFTRAELRSDFHRAALYVPAVAFLAVNDGLTYPRTCEALQSNGSRLHDGLCGAFRVCYRFSSVCSYARLAVATPLETSGDTVRHRQNPAFGGHEFRPLVRIASTQTLQSVFNAR